MKKNRIRSLSVKIRRIVSLVVVCAVVLIGLLIFALLNQAYRERLFDNNKNIILNIQQQMELELSSVEELAAMICSDNYLQRLVTGYNEQAVGTYDFYRLEREISSELSRYVMLKNELIDDVFFLDPQGWVVSRNSYEADAFHSNWFRDFPARGEKAAFTGIHEVTKRESSFQGDTRRVLTYLVSMNNLQGSLEEMGYLVMNIKIDTLLRELNSFPDLRYRLFDDKGEDIQSTTNRFSSFVWEAGTTAVEVRSGRQPYYGISVEKCGWFLVSGWSSAQSRGSLIRMLGIVSAVLLVILLVSEWSIHYQVQRMTRPLHRLMVQMTLFSEGDYTVKADVSTHDEIEVIASVFNEMVDSIHSQMKENIRKEKEKRKREVGFLMAQIKPHFIYNCLNSIIYLARQNRTEDIILFTRSFISVLQASIRKRPTELVGLKDELVFLQHYLTLMSYRYGYSPQLEQEVPEEEVKLPALILQPLLENSLIHGNTLNTSVSTVTVAARRRDGRIEIHVIDDGEGISPEKAEKITRKLQEETGAAEYTEHIGLINVNQRLRLCYGEESGLHIDSREGRTDIWFAVPDEQTA